MTPKIDFSDTSHAPAGSRFLYDSGLCLPSPEKKYIFPCKAYYLHTIDFACAYVENAASVEMHELNLLATTTIVARPAAISRAESFSFLASGKMAMRGGIHARCLADDTMILTRLSADGPARLGAPYGRRGAYATPRARRRWPPYKKASDGISRHDNHEALSREARAGLMHAARC